MSHIPNSVMPHAGPRSGNDERSQPAESESRLGRIADKVREHPRASMAAGAAVVAGLAATAAIPALRARSGRAKSAKSKS